jgi:hypothetical protein
MSDGLAIISMSHTPSLNVSEMYGGELTEINFEVFYSHTIVRKGKNVTFYYQTQEEFFPRLKAALQGRLAVGQQALNL